MAPTRTGKTNISKLYKWNEICWLQFRKSRAPFRLLVFRLPRRYRFVPVSNVRFVRLSLSFRSHVVHFSLLFRFRVSSPPPRNPPPYTSLSASTETSVGNTVRSHWELGIYTLGTGTWELGVWLELGELGIYALRSDFANRQALSLPQLITNS